MAYSGYTCITCSVAFVSAELQRDHYKTDWHRYNLKRKVAELPPVTSEDFKQKVLTQRTADAKARERHSHYCEACKKAFASDKSFESHLRSKKHKEREANAPSETDDGIEEATENATDEVIKKTLHNLKNLKIELSEVSLADDREEEQVIEVEGSSIKTLEVNKDNASSVDAKTTRRKIGSDHTKPSLISSKEKDKECLSECSDEDSHSLEVDECLFCPQVSESIEDSLQHMSSAHGFFLPDLDYLVDLKGLVEYLCCKVGEERACLYCQTSRTFYSIEAIQHHMVDRAHCKLFFEGDSALEYAEFYEYTKSYSSMSKQEETTGEKEEEGDLPVPDGSLEVNQDLELVLPSGSRVSHRSMRQYYKQRLPTLEQRTSSVVTRLMAQYRAIGWRRGEEGEEERKKRVMDESWRRRMQQRRQLKLSVKANKQQPHFRPQVVF